MSDTMIDPTREILSFLEKIALAELEEVKAKERVFELKFQKSRYDLDIYNLIQQQASKPKV